MTENLLEVKNLKKYFPVRGGVFLRVVDWVHAVDGINFDLKKGETLGLVGESGCGKTTVLRLLMRLIEPTDGSALFDGRDIFQMKKNELKKLRLEMALIFQDPYSSLNPRMTVLDIISEPMIVKGGVGRSERKKRVMELLETVELSAHHIDRYPHEFSGGQKQRIGIARALAVDPKLIFGDEPVSSLDVSVRAGVLNLMKRLQRELDLTYLYVSHNLRVVKHVSDRVMVMYLGKGVELGPTKEIYEDPIHPYTKALVSAIPTPDPAKKTDRIILEGTVPTPINPPSGCRFHPRCWMAEPICAKEEPEFIEYEGGRFVACHLARERKT